MAQARSDRGEGLRGGRRAGRQGGRAANRAKRSGGLAQLPRSRFINTLAPLEPLSADEIESIHQASLEVLRDIGMSFMHPRALAVLREHGAEVANGSDVVKMPPELVEAYLSKVPARFVWRSRNPAVRHEVGGSEMLFSPVASAPNCSDLDLGRRAGNFEDYKNLIRLSQAFNVLTFIGGYPVEPADLPPETRHLDALAFLLEASDKPFAGYALGRARMLDALEIARRGAGLKTQDFDGEAYLMTVINTSSPLRLDANMIEGMIEMARCNQPIIITPFTLSGAMAPATVAGALVQQNAEALACLVFTQMLRSGARCVYGSFTSNVDMRSGAPAFGTPEYVKAVLVSGQLARRYRIPYRASNCCAANAVDAQASYESMFSLWASVLGGVHLCKQSAGWMEGGLVASFEKLVLDVELLQNFAALMQPLELDADSLGLEAMREVGQGGHFFGAAHTVARYESAFYEPLVSDWRNFGAWKEAGAPDAATHCNRVWKGMLTGFTPPTYDRAHKESVDAYVARRKRDGGADSLPEEFR